MALPARIGLALVAVVVAATFAVELRGHRLLESARQRAGDSGQRALSPERRRDVLADLESAGRLRPGTDALVLRARVEAKAGRYDQSLALARRAVAKEPDSYLAWAVLTYVLVAKKDVPAARRALDRARELNPLVLKRG
jgi:tetratricopeptide (TPR) repeat protein